MSSLKPKDLCFIIKASKPENLGKIVEIVRVCYEANSCADNQFYVIPENDLVYWKKKFLSTLERYVVRGSFGKYEYRPFPRDCLKKVVDPDEVKEYDNQEELINTK